MWTARCAAGDRSSVSGGESLFYGAYDDVGGSPWGVVRTAFTEPLTIVSVVTGGGDFVYVVLLAAPLGGLFFLAPGLAAVALPQLAANLLAGRTHTPTRTRTTWRGSCRSCGPLLLLVSHASLRRTGVGRRWSFVLLSLAATVAVGPWPKTLLGAETWDSLGTLDTSRDHVRALERAVALVPDDSPVSATNRVGSHLAARRYAYSAPVLGRADWVVLDTTDTWVPVGFGGTANGPGLERLRERLDASRAWRRVFEEDGVVVFEKTPS